MDAQIGQTVEFGEKTPEPATRDLAGSTIQTPVCSFLLHRLGYLGFGEAALVFSVLLDCGNLAKVLDTPSFRGNMVEDNSLERARGETTEQERQHDQLRNRALQAALLELMGPIAGKSRACEFNDKCQANKGTFPQDEHFNLYQDLKKLADWDGGGKVQRFKNDVEFINDRLNYTEFVGSDKKPKQSEQLKFKLTGIDESSQHVLLQRGALFEFLDENGLHTIKPAHKRIREFFGTELKNRQDRSTQWIEPPPAISADSVNQLQTNNCYFLSPAASLAELQPDAIKHMIAKNKDGTYTVTFPGEREHPQTVAPPNLAEKQFFVDGPSAKWIQILDKANRKRIGAGVYEPYGTPSEILTLLTGKQSKVVDWDKMDDPQAQTTVSNELKADIAKRLPIVAISPKFQNDSMKEDGVVAGHGYSLLRFDPDSGLITLRNPVGVNDRYPTEKFKFVRPGVFQIPVLKFIHDFVQLGTISDQSIDSNK